MFCKKCGSAVEANEKFCGVCGEHLAPPVEEAPVETPVEAPVEAPVETPIETPAEAPAYQQPVYQAPVEAPVYQQPVYQAPVQPPVYAAPVAPQAPYAPRPVAPAKPKNPGKVMGMISMILGIVSMISAPGNIFLIIAILTFPIAIAAIVLGAIGNKKSKKAGMKNGMAKAGLILGIVSFVIGIAIAAIPFAMYGLSFLTMLGISGLGAASDILYM